MIGGAAGGLSIAAIVGLLQIQDALVWEKPHQDQHGYEQVLASVQSDKQQIQIINVQIIQIEQLLEPIDRRANSKTPIEGDNTRRARLINKLIRLEAAKEELERK